jgi:hypothetical protein
VLKLRKTFPICDELLPETRVWPTHGFPSERGPDLGLRPITVHTGEREIQFAVPIGTSVPSRFTTYAWYPELTPVRLIAATAAAKVL